MFDSVMFMVQTGSAALAEDIGTKLASRASTVEATTMTSFIINTLRSRIVPVYLLLKLLATNNLITILYLTGRESIKSASD
jgi:hypothetical protein